MSKERTPSKTIFRHSQGQIELIRECLKGNQEEINNKGLTKNSLADYVGTKLGFKVTANSMQSVRMRLENQGVHFNLKMEKRAKKDPMQQSQRVEDKFNAEDIDILHIIIHNFKKARNSN